MWISIKSNQKWFTHRLTQYKQIKVIHYMSNIQSYDMVFDDQASIDVLMQNLILESYILSDKPSTSMTNATHKILGKPVTAQEGIHLTVKFYELILGRNFDEYCLVYSWPFFDMILRKSTVIFKRKSGWLHRKSDPT